MHSPAGRAQHQVSSLPLISLLLYGTVAAALKVVVNRCRHMAVRPVNYIRRTNSDGRKEGVRRAVSATRRGVVHEIEPAPDILLAQRFELVQLGFNLLPRPMQRFDFYVIRVNQLLV